MQPGTIRLDELGFSWSRTYSSNRSPTLHTPATCSPSRTQHPHESYSARSTVSHRCWLRCVELWDRWQLLRCSLCQRRDDGWVATSFGTSWSSWLVSRQLPLGSWSTHRANGGNKGRLYRVGARKRAQPRTKKVPLLSQGTRGEILYDRDVFERVYDVYIDVHRCDLCNSTYLSYMSWPLWCVTCLHSPSWERSLSNREAKGQAMLLDTGLNVNTVYRVYD